MDGLSTAASAVGIVVAAVQSVQILVRTIEDIKDAPREVQAIRRDLETLASIFAQLDRFLQDNDRQQTDNAPTSTMWTATDNCRIACDDFQGLLKHWLRHSTQTHMFWTDRWRIGLFGVSRTKAFRERLSDYKDTLCLSLQTANLLRQMPKGVGVEAETVKNARLLESDARARLDRARKQAEKIESGHQVVLFEIHHLAQAPEGAAEDIRRDVVRDFEVLQEANRLLQEVCLESMEKAATARRAQKIQDVKASNDSTALAGYINTDDLGEIDQDIRHITADTRSVAVAGVVKGVDFNSLFSKR
ncbi:hypothetical protein HYQ45_004379 [Verticillium longisporum]|uniref:Azaphilone pigments biosynthesis cluster protein L N-terminal domain-containing protein n=1 Tax=Verticillium longisporum TaxID=100787 RepID=A0A8I3AXZ7_VERLO|nr:hypothetical protein HYQ44_019481 [Verticillium longisporum]KAG7138507.1 hypothetical protein HYQ45_004379 [Verticillium longisporum]KAG7146206.1 hypothetical protein HYQ46_005004 [Verticillium longisporum]